MDQRQLELIKRRTQFKRVYLLWFALIIGGTIVCWNNNTWMMFWASFVLFVGIVIWVRSFRQDRDDILLWLVIRGGWHYGLDLVKAGIAHRGSVYIHLARLQEQGLVERRDEAQPDPRVGARPQFRAVV